MSLTQDELFCLMIGHLPRRHRLPPRERPDLELPAGGVLLVTDDAEVGEIGGLELGDELFTRQGVMRTRSSMYVLLLSGRQDPH